MTDTQPSAPVETGGNLGTPNVFKRDPLTQQEMYQIAAALGAQIVWTFEPAVEATDDLPGTPGQYVGTAPYGRFAILRDAGGGLVATFQNKAELEHPGEGGSFNVGMTLPECPDVTAAKGAVTLRLVQSMNQTHRDDPMLTAGAGVAEPDLI